MADRDDPQPTAPKPVGARFRIAVIVAVAAVLGGVLISKAIDASPTAPVATTSAQSTTTTAASGGPSQTRGDVVVAYEAALKTGKPVYVLFHSLTCQPCVEISAVADQVVPGYADRLTFVNAITDDPKAQELAARFSFQYIPTSFFLKPDGTITDSFTGVLTAEEMRGRLDTLIGQ